MADGEDVGNVDIGDISNSPAFTALNELTGDGTLTQAQGDFYKSKFLKLHEVDTTAPQPPKPNPTLRNAPLCTAASLSPRRSIQVVLQTYENEKNMLKRAKELNEGLRKVASPPGLLELCHAGSTTLLATPGGNRGAHLKSISHRCHPISVAFAWELTKHNRFAPGVPPGWSTTLLVAPV